MCFFPHLYCSREATSQGASRAALTYALLCSTASSGSEEDGVPQAPTQAHTEPQASLSVPSGQVQVAHSQLLGERASFRVGSAHICTCCRLYSGNGLPQHLLAAWGGP